MHASAHELRKLHNPLGKSIMDKSGHQELFEKFCEENYLGKHSTSKTVCKVKAEKIREVVQGRKLKAHSSAFRFWVKKKKKFKVLSYPELNLHDVLCLPVKVKVLSN